MCCFTVYDSGDDSRPQGGDGEASSSESEGQLDGSGEEDNTAPDSGSWIQGQSGTGNLHVAVQSGDPNQVVILKQQRTFTDQEKLGVLEHSFVPPRGYTYPTRIINGCKRHFQSSWLSNYNGLVYSESADGGFCKYCVFAKGGPTVKELGVLVNKPLTNFKKGTEKLDKHFHGKQFHKAAIYGGCIVVHFTRPANK